MKKILFATARAVAVCAVLFVGAAVGSAFIFRSTEADAARSASGTYSKLYTFTSGSVINSSNMNSQMSDLETEMTDSLSRSGKGGMLAVLRGVDGAVGAPAYSWTSDTSTGEYRIGSGDLGWSISGTKKLELTTSAFTITPNTTISGQLGVGGAPTHPLDVTNSGTAATAMGNFLEASVANGNALTLNLGSALAANAAASVTFTPNATAANSTACFGVAGSASAICTDGNNKTYIGSAGTGISVLYKGTCNLNGGTPARCTQTVPAAAIHCVCSADTDTSGGACSTSVSATTLTISGTNGSTSEAFAICTN